MADQLEEAVARAIEPEIFADRDMVAAQAPEYLVTYSGQALIDEAFAKARAVIPVVLEEAARVAHDYKDRMKSEDDWFVPVDIAARIRQLSEPQT
jgi:hypothetical protein